MNWRCHKFNSSSYTSSVLWFPSAASNTGLWKHFLAKSSTLQPHASEDDRLSYGLEFELTFISINIFLHGLRNSAIHWLFCWLRRNFTADVIIAANVQGPLQSVSFPAKDVVTMLAMSRAISRCSASFYHSRILTLWKTSANERDTLTHRPEHRRKVGCHLIPKLLLIIWRGIPHNFIHNLR